MIGDEFVRIEVVGENGANGSGCGNTFGRIMVERELLPTPTDIKHSDQHWFTPLGFERIGKAIILDAEKRRIPLEIKRMKFNDIRRHNITYRDEFQLTISRFRRDERR